ncbi:DUF4181 domain-containing protein [Bacillus sp. JJ1566]|uniref:DUF4181 domain-containing protein n=1 Tax=Bacillus sp. JJ1566 TaxID=3122961 RepID=UPI002FFE6ECB
MWIILALFLSLLGVVDRLVGKRLEPGYNVMESDGSVKYRVGSILILIPAMIGIFMVDYNETDTFKWLLILVLIMYWGFQAFMEWKYVEGKKYKLSLLLLGVGVMATWVIFFVDDIIKHTTYGEEISELLDAEKTNKITILWPKETKNNKDIYLKTTISDPAFINKLITEPSDMEIIKSDYFNFTLHEMNISFHYGNESSMIFLNEDHIQINGEHYQISGENRLYNLIINEGLDWVED